MGSILSKGKRVDNGKWVKGYYFEREERSFIITDSYPADEEYDCMPMRIIAVEVVPETIEVSTTLDDKNCKTIYSGDMVKTKFFGKSNSNGVNFNDYDTFKVVFHDGQFFLENETRRFTLTAEVARKIEILEEQK